MKRIFGGLLTVLGIAGLIYTAMLYMNSSGDFKSLIVYGVIGIIFFIAGIGLIKKTKDES